MARDGLCLTHLRQRDEPHIFEHRVVSNDDAEQEEEAGQSSSTRQRTDRTTLRLLRWVYQTAARRQLTRRLTLVSAATNIRVATLRARARREGWAVKRGMPR